MRIRLSGVKESPSSETRNIVCQEILNYISVEKIKSDSAKARYARIFSNIFTGCGDSAVVEEAVQRFLDAFNMPDDMPVVFDRLRYMLLMIDFPIPTNFKVACPDARRILGEAMLKRTPLVEKLKSDAGLYWQDASRIIADLLLDPIVQACRNVELLLEIREKLLAHPSENSKRVVDSVGAVLVKMFEERTLPDENDPKVLAVIYQHTGKTAIVEHIFENCLFGEGKERLVHLIDSGSVSVAAVDTAGRMLERLDETHAPVIFIVARHHKDGKLRKSAVDRLAGDYIVKLFHMPCIGQGAYIDTQKYAINMLERLGRTGILRRIFTGASSDDMRKRARRAISRYQKRRIANES